MLGDWFFDNDQWEFSRAFYQAVLGMEMEADGSWANPNHYGYYPYGRLGFIHYGAGRYKEAIEMLREALNRAPEPFKDDYRKLIKKIQHERKGKP